MFSFPVPTLEKEESSFWLGHTTITSLTLHRMDQIGGGSAGKPEAVCPRTANENTSGSIATRIRHSASRLISNSFSRLSPSSEISSLASFSEEASKEGSVFASTNSSELGSSSVLQSSQYSSNHGFQQHGPNITPELETFQPWKNRGNNHSFQSAFEEFMSQEAPRPQLQQDLHAIMESQLNTSDYDANKLWVRNGKTRTAAPPEIASVWSRQTTRPAPGIYLDGAAVVAILRDPEFSPDGDLEHLNRRPTEDFEEEDNDMPRVCPLTDLRERSTVFASRTVNLDSSVSNEKLSITIGGVSQETIPIEPHRSCDLMTADCKLLSWLKSFKSYQDEVWGDMSYLARESHEEKAAQGNIQETVRKHGASERLAMIVRHVNHTIQRK